MKNEATFTHPTLEGLNDAVAKAFPKDNYVPVEGPLEKNGRWHYKIRMIDEPKVKYVGMDLYLVNGKCTRAFEDINGNWVTNPPLESEDLKLLREYVTAKCQEKVQA